MEQYIMKGGNPLVGEVVIGGAKNAALGILAAAIMTDDDVLIEFTGNRELVLQANNAAMLTKMIKWASTAASVVSAPASRVMEDKAPDAVLFDNDPLGLNSEPKKAPLILDMNNIPNPDDIDEGDVW